MFSNLEAEHVDLISPGAAMTPARQERFDFTTSLGYDYRGLFAHPKTGGGGNGLESHDWRLFFQPFTGKAWLLLYVRTNATSILMDALLLQ